MRSGGTSAIGQVPGQVLGDGGARLVVEQVRIVAVRPDPGDQPFVLEQQPVEAVQDLDLAERGGLLHRHERGRAEDRLERQVAVERVDPPTEQRQAGPRQPEVAGVAQDDVPAVLGEGRAEQVGGERHLGEVFELAGGGHDPERPAGTPAT